MVSALTELSGLAPLSAKEVAAFAAAGMRTAADVLDHLPKRHEDRRSFDLFPNQPTLHAVCLRGTVVDTSRRRFGSKGGFFEAVVMDGSGGVFGSGKITCRWFNMPFIHKLVAAGHEVVVYGKVKESNGKLVVDHPEFEILREEDESGASIHMDRVVPVYQNIAGLSQRRLREITHLLLTRCDPATLTSPFFGVDTATTRATALRDAHFPESLEQAHNARRKFALEEFFTIQLNVAWRRAVYQQQDGRVRQTHRPARRFLPRPAL